MSKHVEELKAIALKYSEAERSQGKVKGVIKKGLKFVILALVSYSLINKFVKENDSTASNITTEELIEKYAAE